MCTISQLLWNFRQNQDPSFSNFLIPIFINKAGGSQIRRIKSAILILGIKFLFIRGKWNFGTSRLLLSNSELSHLVSGCFLCSRTLFPPYSYFAIQSSKGHAFPTLLIPNLEYKWLWDYKLFTSHRHGELNYFGTRVLLENSNLLLSETLELLLPPLSSIFRNPLVQKEHRRLVIVQEQETLVVMNYWVEKRREWKMETKWNVAREEWVFWKI